LFLKNILSALTVRNVLSFRISGSSAILPWMVNLESRFRNLVMWFGGKSRVAISYLKKPARTIDAAMKKLAAGISFRRRVNIQKRNVRIKVESKSPKGGLKISPKMIPAIKRIKAYKPGRLIFCSKDKI
jgi:hypothetical protein